MRNPLHVDLSGAFTLALALLPFGILGATDCNGNGIDDSAEVAAGTALDCNRDRVPDDCDVRPVNYDLDGPRLTIGTSGGPLALSDHDGDDRFDLAVAGPTIRVLTGDGEGGFGPGVDVINARGRKFLWAADLDGDRHPELVYDTDLGIGIAFNPLRLRGEGVGFVPVETAFEIRGLAVHDLDRDGDLDLAAAGGFRVQLFLNSGRASFTPGATLGNGSSPVLIAALDLDSDGDADLATANSVARDLPGNVSVFMALGAGTFALPRNYGVGRDPASFEATDLDGDGDPDFAVAATQDHAVSLLFNQGDGTFASAGDLEVAQAPEGLLAADLDVDGDIDLAAASPSGSKLSFLFSHGQADFGPRIARSLPLGVRYLGAADLDLNGFPEVVATAPFLGEALVLSRVFSAYSGDCNRNGVPDECEVEIEDCNRNSIPDDCDISSAESLDCNDNALPDECEPDCNRNGATDACDLSSGASGDCNQNDIPDECDIEAGILFGPPASLQVETERAHDGDLDGDGDRDLVLSLVSGGAAVRLHRGDGAFEAGETVPEGQVHALGDLDGDGDLDLGAAHGGSGMVSVHLNRGDASFEPAGVHTGLGGVTELGAGDIDADGDLDLVAGDVGGGITTLLNRGVGHFEAPVVSATLLGAPGGVLVRDVDEDGRSDLVAWPPLTLLWAGEGGFEVVRLSAFERVRDVVAADLDGDADLDLAASGVVDSDTAILFNLGRRAFAPAARLDCCGFPGPVAAGDLDLDGDSDLVLQGFIAQELMLQARLQGRPGEFRSAAIPIGAMPATRLLAADLSGDGLPDLLGVLLLGGFCPACPSSITVLSLNLSTKAAHADNDHDGVPDDCEGKLFHRGDANVDGDVDLSDAVFILGYLFLGEPPSGCTEAADADDDGVLLLTDAVFLLGFLFQGGPEPPPPGPPPAPCGPDNDPPGSPRHLGCEAYELCGR